MKKLTKLQFKKRRAQAHMLMDEDRSRLRYQVRAIANLLDLRPECWTSREYNNLLRGLRRDRILLTNLIRRMARSKKSMT